MQGDFAGSLQTINHAYSYKLSAAACMSKKASVQLRLQAVMMRTVLLDIPVLLWVMSGE